MFTTSGCNDVGIRQFEFVNIAHMFFSNLIFPLQLKFVKCF